MLNLVRAAQQREGVAKQSFFTTALALYSQILYQLKVANEHLHSEAALKDPTALHDMVRRAASRCFRRRRRRPTARRVLLAGL